VYELNGRPILTSYLQLYSDDGGSPFTDSWNAIWIPPVRSRLQAQIKGTFNLTQGDVQSIPYLCGFETQITGRRSPFCDILTEAEALGYEYAQDLRYWYGTGLGSDIEKYQMLPAVDMVSS
jgi:acid phosphatase